MTVGDDDLEDIGDKMEDTLTNLKKCELRYENFLIYLM